MILCPPGFFPVWGLWPVLPQRLLSSVSPSRLSTAPLTQAKCCQTPPLHPPPQPQPTAGPPASPRCDSRLRNTLHSSPSSTSCRLEPRGRRCAEHSTPARPPVPFQETPVPQTPHIHYLWRLLNPDAPLPQLPHAPQQNSTTKFVRALAKWCVTVVSLLNYILQWIYLFYPNQSEPHISSTNRLKH